MSLTWRPLTMDDMPRLAETFAAAERVEPIDEHYSAEDLAEEIASPNVDLPTATTSAWDGETLVAYGLLRRRDAANPAHMVRVETLVHPEYREDAIAAHLTGWFEEAGKRVHAKSFPDAPLELHAAANTKQRWLSDVLVGAGYEHARWFVDMRADLASIPPVKPLPEEFPLVTYEEKYEALTLRSRNETFADHWGSTAQSPEAWRHLVVGGKDFQPDLSFLLLSPARDKVVAMVLSAFFASDEAATGVKDLYVSHVATDASLRGRGIASALLGRTLVQAEAKGFQRASLNVDQDNTHRALGVYERVGFSEHQRWAGYVKPIPT
ncbi:GNAT family N-acetyltransferase [Amycolatopsis regifaucium]|uniref:Acetyltransferase n=1 Tax=Amycolatopsis regifaucium TaxID=546365 RepID=A0A154M6Z6_9PSEU|nr:GNAT family N-acetyltransferase [Amycolatopsis regifaucium]KZB80398.1 acetyltransferase [Amycolatopsis regifaucium]OKA05367.1 GNAT family N-acetyltransferase [Amycolatopsis regifaucium]SFJ07805.1 Acetyltransferase (GNAT) family protein [Amycolatopsis regifaucium]